MYFPPPLSRRDFLKISALSLVGLTAGCAANPVTGESQFMLVSRDQEISIDKQQSPYQFSADYGAVQDQALSQYVTEVGMSLATKTHRPDMPYSFRPLNAVYVNAYAFPGGSIGLTRAIMLQLDNEAELAALLGHELGHVNARHTAARMSKGQLTSLVVGLGAAVAGTVSENMGDIAAGLGNLGTGALLARYSREDERQADDLGMLYMMRAGYDTEGMVGLMDMLNEQHQANPSALELMFATHPMSSERLATARQAAAGKYATSSEYRLNRERYLDNTASLRRIKPAIQEMQKGSDFMGKKDYAQAAKHFEAALKHTPNDYAGLLLLAKCRLVQKNYAEAARRATRAQAVYPQEPQALQVAGMAQLGTREYDKALKNFTAYDKQLPGNPYTSFYKGLALEKMGHRQDAAKQYYQFLQSVNQGEQAKYAYTRLKEWGYVQ
ncbi:M48 family metalloprotease [Desulfoplanes formicivorans]|uniref:Peptidase M48 Ste24p n=1 Tax=Desulfoplanes formicivorans TaxID=1592317 RepID=A0A194AHE0_9BACT|nr:M48 family metalloprotease [Desulfoplanes formicivorans]GAU08630.1 peptidase M48 Ste24p [Desulfoplanes formicivorans]